MSEPFCPGDIVECVDCRAPGDPRQYGCHAFIGEVEVRPGGLYTVACAYTHPNCGALLKLRGMRRNSADIGYFAWRFRKIHRPRAEFLQELLSAPIDIFADKETA